MRRDLVDGLVSHYRLGNLIHGSPGTREGSGPKSEAHRDDTGTCRAIAPEVAVACRAEKKIRVIWGAESLTRTFDGTDKSVAQVLGEASRIRRKRLDNPITNP